MAPLARRGFQRQEIYAADDRPGSKRGKTRKRPSRAKCVVAHTIDSPVRHFFKITYTSATMTQPLIEYGNPLRIAEQLDETGVVCLENAVPEEWLGQARADVQDRLLNHGVHDHFIRSPQGEGHSAAEAFIASPSVLSLLTD